MASEREITIEVLGVNPDIEHYVWIPDRRNLEDAMAWCVRNLGDVVSWQLLLASDPSGYEEVGIGFIEKDTAMMFLIRYGGRYEKKEA